MQVKSLLGSVQDVTPLRWATCGTVVVAGLAFSMSFTKLTSLAQAHGTSQWQAWMLPVIVDGLVVVSTAASAAMKRGRWYAWALLVLGTLISVAGNIAYAVTAVPGDVIAVGIAILPPVVLFLVTHLTIQLAHQNVVADQSVSVEENEAQELSEGALVAV